MNKPTNFEQYLEKEIKKHPGLRDELDKAGLAIDIAMQIYDLRKKRELTQKELAAKIDVKQSNIARLEDAEYEGYTLQTLKKVVAALDAELNISLTPKEDSYRQRKSRPFPSPYRAVGLRDK